MVMLETIDNSIACDLGITYYCPDNTKGLTFDLEYVQKCVSTDWALVLLGVGSRYLEQDSLLEFASEHGSTLMEVELFSTESSTRRIVDYLKDTVSQTDLETWAKAFEKLFYVAIHWLRDNFDDSIDDYQYSFETLWDDFCFISVAYESLFFPPSPPYRPTKRQKKRFDKYLYNWVVFNSQKFLEEEKSKIEREDFHRSEWLENFESILKGWKMRYYEGEIPQLVKDYEESHKKL